MFGDARRRRERDNEKSQTCLNLGILLIGVPYWWRQDKQSVISMLHQYRPDITIPTGIIHTNCQNNEFRSAEQDIFCSKTCFPQHYPNGEPLA